MQKIDISRFVCIGGILISSAVLFQAAPVYLPTVGLILSPFSTLPIGIAAAVNISLGLTVFLGAALILAVISLQETLILIFTTGLLGMVMGAFIYRKGMIKAILFSSIALYIGMLFLTYVLGFTAFVELTKLFSTLLIHLVFFLFSLIYSTIWNVCFRKFIKRFRLLPFL